ncbi:uncharacterized protein MYCGRDRAFT_104086 [Zymoseptoria tritici IPO323]|uniref:Uncharacterized protein n=1 Tax=Zymoseptoria tritici (strain CBS 115943 / IPO323) TaxID=336722 RepID=F9X8A3_ZYMTI|nr:uncharacterized protein MYCGRDRAFT_104086 [Zymoseptoria tritici IPO323]EGP88484.1 hypothetical protein MYCGRDRAFT_104086 [Zymoseptoria tritici IPO323]
MKHCRQNDLSCFILFQCSLPVRQVHDDVLHSPGTWLRQLRPARGTDGSASAQLSIAGEAPPRERLGRRRYPVIGSHTPIARSMSILGKGETHELWQQHRMIRIMA